MADQKFLDALEQAIDAVPSNVTAAFVRDMTTYATKAWGYEPDVALMMARRSVEHKDAYYAMYSIGYAWREFESLEVMVHGKPKV